MEEKKKKPIKKTSNLYLDPKMMTFVNKMGKYYESFGISRIGGQIVGLMLVIDSPISPEDIQNLLHVSRSSISTNLKMLLLNAGVEEVHLQGDRKSYYMLSEHAVEQSILRKINSYSYLKQVVDEGIDTLKKKGKPIERLLGVNQWIAMDVESSLEILNKWKNITNKSKT